MKTAILKEPEDANESLRMIYRRRSVRKYNEKRVTPALIDRLLNAGRMAPSALNNQPWKFLVVTDLASIQALSADIVSAARKVSTLQAHAQANKTVSEQLPEDFFDAPDPVFHGASTVIFITGPKSGEWSSLDIGMCAQNIMLAAKASELDSCPVGFATFVDQSPLYPQLGIIPDDRVYLAIVVGYGSENPAVHPRITDNVRIIAPLHPEETHRSLAAL